MNTILSVGNLTKSFRKKGTVKVAVNNLSFESYEGEIFGLLGPNGAGKTTTMRMLSTLIKPDSGDAFIDGTSINKKPEIVRSKIGFLTSELKLDDYFTPAYLYDFFSDLYGIDGQVSKKRKNFLFERFEITDFADTKIVNLSQGMKQKVSLVSKRQINRVP